MNGEKSKQQSVLGGLFDNSDPNDPYDFLKILPNPDGSLTRLLPDPKLPPNTHPPPPPLHPTHHQQQQQQHCVLSKDVPLNPSNHTWLRIYRPHLSSPTSFPLPIIIFFHGGGFILFSAASAHYHHFCDRLALYVPAVVLGVDYRLAPEHRLPAAYHDAMDALRWVKQQEQLPSALRDPWMAPEIVDLSRCFLLGSSSGGNIAYYLWQQEQELPCKIAGVLLDQPFFGGVERTESELRMADSLVVPLPVSDLMWELALPEGAHRDHEFSNPATLEKKKKKKSGSEVASHSQSLPPCLVRASAHDPLVDRQRAVMKMMEQKGGKVVGHLADDGYHAVQFFDDDEQQTMLMEIKHFISSVTSTTNA